MEKQVTKIRIFEKCDGKIKKIEKYNRKMGGKIGKLEKINGKMGGKILITENMVAKLEHLEM